jgi:hypothetical protein
LSRQGKATDETWQRPRQGKKRRRPKQEKARQVDRPCKTRQGTGEARQGDC